VCACVHDVRTRERGERYTHMHRRNALSPRGKKGQCVCIYIYIYVYITDTHTNRHSALSPGGRKGQCRHPSVPPPALIIQLKNFCCAQHGSDVSVCVCVCV